MNTVANTPQRELKVQFFMFHSEKERENDLALFIKKCVKRSKSVFRTPGMNVWDIVIPGHKSGNTIMDELEDYGCVSYSDENIIIDVAYDSHIFFGLK